MPPSDRPLTLEPKYCELCGSLWLRPTGSAAIYCVACRRVVDDLQVRLRSDQHPRLRRQA